MKYLKTFEQYVSEFTNSPVKPEVDVPIKPILPTKPVKRDIKQPSVVPAPKADKEVEVEYSYDEYGVEARYNDEIKKEEENYENI